MFVTSICCPSCNHYVAYFVVRPDAPYGSINLVPKRSFRCSVCATEIVDGSTLRMRSVSHFTTLENGVTLRLFCTVCSTHSYPDSLSNDLQFCPVCYPNLVVDDQLTNLEGMPNEWDVL